MKKDLKLLARWYYGEGCVITEDKNNEIIEVYFRNTNETIYFSPRFDANQLNELEQKMINEESITEIEIVKKEKWDICYMSLCSIYSKIFLGKGKTIQEAKLNTIINYLNNIHY